MSDPIRMRTGVPERSPGADSYERTNERTNEESLLPTRDNPDCFVTRAPAYGFSPLADSTEETHRPGWFTCKVCVPNVHERGGQAEFYAHWMTEHYTPPEEQS